MELSKRKGWQENTDQAIRILGQKLKEYCQFHKYDYESYQKSLYVRDYLWTYYNSAFYTLQSSFEHNLQVLHSEIGKLNSTGLIELLSHCSSFNITMNYDIRSNDNIMMHLFKGVEYTCQCDKHYTKSWVGVANSVHEENYELNCLFLFGKFTCSTLQITLDSFTQNANRLRSFAATVSMLQKQALVKIDLRQSLDEALG